MESTKIRNIQIYDLPEIEIIQSACYHSSFQEPIDVIRSKNDISPETCFVLELENKIIGYCLSHPFELDEIPELFSYTIRAAVQSKNLFLHDLAIHPNYQNRGFSKILFSRILEYTNSNKIQNITIVSVQNSIEYWKQFGFELLNHIIPKKEYGENSFAMRLCLTGKHFI